MALFNSSKDASFINSINYELVGDIIEQNVNVYKYDLSTTQDNLYDEGSSEKTYSTPIQVPCIVTKDDEEWEETEFGVDINQTVRFAFLKDMLVKRAKIAIEIGDIIGHDNAYWEVHSTVENQYFGGRRPEDPNMVGGASISIIASAHLTRQSKVAIEDINANRSSEII